MLVSLGPWNGVRECCRLRSPEADSKVKFSIWDLLEIWGSNSVEGKEAGSCSGGSWAAKQSQQRPQLTLHGVLKLGWPFKIVSCFRERSEPLHFPSDQSLDVDCPLGQGSCLQPRIVSRERWQLRTISQKHSQQLGQYILLGNLVLHHSVHYMYR